MMLLWRIDNQVTTGNDEMTSSLKRRMVHRPHHSPPTMLLAPPVNNPGNDVITCPPDRELSDLSEGSPLRLL